MPFYPCRGGGNINIDNAVHKAFTSESNGLWITTYTLETSYKIGHIVAYNDAAGNVYVSVNGVEQAFESMTKDGLFFKSVLLLNLKKGDVLVVRGGGMGVFIK